MSTSRREFIRDLGLSAASLPFILNLPSLGFAGQTKRKQRLVAIFSPNGVVPDTFWPSEEGAKFTLKESLKPLEPFKDRTLVLHGVSDKIRGDGDGHMRGIGCLLTGIELFPGNIQGGSDTPAGWASGHLDRSGNQEPPAKGSGNALSLWVAGIRRLGAASSRYLDPLGLCRCKQARRPNR